MLDRRQFIAAAALLAGSGGAPLNALADIKGDYVAFRFAMRGDQPVAAMTIGKSKPYLVLLDTGNTFGAALKESICKELDLEQAGTGRVYGATGTDTVEGYNAHQVVFGGTVLQPDITFMGSKNAAGLDGIVPLGLFTDRYTEMDFTEGLIRMQTSGQPDHTGFRPLRCDRLRGGPFIADCEVEGTTARLLVDTGAATTVSLNPAFVRAHGLWDGHAKFLPDRFGGITGAVSVAHTVKLKSLKVGDFRFQDPVVSLTDPKLTVAAEKFDGLLGIEILRRFTLGFDGRAATVWLKPNDHLADPFFYDHAGMRMKLDNGSALIEEVSPESPAHEAGFKVGDRLREIDSQQKLNGLEARLTRGPLDTPLLLAVVRDGQRIPIKLTPQDWL